MSEDELEYGEDFDEDNDLDKDYQETRSRNQEPEEDDEQHAQKLNGKLEALQQQVESLQQELELERRLGVQTRQQYEEELKIAWQKQSLAEEQGSKAIAGSSSNEELQKYKKKCQILEDKLEMALLTGNSSADKLPIPLEEAFHKFCENNNIFGDHADKILSMNDCLNILKLADANKKKKKSMAGDQLSAPPSADTAIRSNNTVNRLSERIRYLEEELRVAETAAKDAESMKGKIFQASERIRVEKEQKRALEIELNATKKKVEMLGDHIEKLVVHIKREGAQKMRLAEQLRTQEKESIKSKEKSEYIQKKSAAKDRLILELREGSKVLEDQLRLMDEKYLELRGKLDYSRSIAAKKIKKAEKTASDLRMKFAMTGSPLVLDAISIPGDYHGGYGEGAFDNDSHGWGNDRGNHPPQTRSALLPPKKSGSVRTLSKAKGHKSVTLDSMSMNSGFSQRSEPTLDGVLDKIKYQTGNRNDWTEEKAKLLAKSR